MLKRKAAHCLAIKASLHGHFPRFYLSGCYCWGRRGRLRAAQGHVPRARREGGEHRGSSSPHPSPRAPITPTEGLLQGQQWNSHITTPPQETPAAFPCIQSHPPPSNGAAHLPLSHLSQTLPHIRGLHLVTKCGFPESTAQSPTQKLLLTGHHSRGKGAAPGNTTWHFQKWRQKLCLFFFHALEGL